MTSRAQAASTIASDRSINYDELNFTFMNSGIIVRYDTVPSITGSSDDSLKKVVSLSNHTIRIRRPILELKLTTTAKCVIRLAVTLRLYKKDNGFQRQGNEDEWKVQ